MAKYDLKAVILRVTVNGKEVVTEAMGDSMTGVPATTDMHFRNGAVAISYVSTLLLELVDQQKVGLDDPLSNWFPDLPNADQVTLRMLANMTAGYADYVIGNEQLATDLYLDPFRQWTPEELIAFSTAEPHVYPPGTNWNYAHTDYVILGQVLEKITGKPMALLMQEYIFAPMGLTDTDGPLRRRSASPCCTPSAPNAERCSAFPHPPPSTRIRPFGIHPGRSRTAPSRRPISTTWPRPR